MLYFLKEIIDNEKGLYHQLYISLFDNAFACEEVRKCTQPD